MAQETFLAAWKHLADLREPASLRPWLCGIARNLVHHSARTQGREPSHRAESLDAIDEPHSPEPWPAERAISREEAEILWRSLERIPETYRLPLVLFYREHQSVETVARNLEMTEEAVRQRMVRGRKLLQEEVMAFVEVALEKTGPGMAFTQGVVAALPLVVATAKTASAGIAAAKGGAGIKGLFSMAAMGGLASMVGAMAFSWKTAIDDTKSPRERRFMVRTAWFQMAFFVATMAVSCFWLPRLSHRSLAYGIVLAATLLAVVINGVWVMTTMVRRGIQIGMEEGTIYDAVGEPGPETDRKAFRKAVRGTIPFLIMLAGTCVLLPWKQHWDRCAVVVAINALVIFWFFRRTRRMLNFRTPPVPSQRVLRHPLISIAVIMFGTALLGGGLGYVLPFFLNPGAPRPGIHYGPWVRDVGGCLLVAVLAFVVFAMIFARKGGIMPGAASFFGKAFGPLLQGALGPSAIIDKTYGPLFQQLNLTSDQQKQLKDLILKKTMVGVKAGMSLMGSRKNAERRAALTLEMKQETENCGAQIRQLLGGENYPAFQQYEKTIPDRTLASQFNSKWAKTPKALNAEQTEQLVRALGEARAQYGWTTDLSRRNQANTNYPVMFGEDNIAAFTREEEQFDQSFLAQAGLILTPEQLAAFEQFQATQRRTQIAGMKMAAKLFAPKDS